MSSSVSSLGVDHELWSRIPLHTSSGSHERRVKEGVPKGVTFCPEEPHSPAQELPFCRYLEKEGEALPRADPALNACCPLLTLLYLSPSLSLCTCRNKSRDCLLLCKPQLHRSLCSSSLCAAAGCLGRASGVLINILCSILGFPCLGLFC